MSNQIYFVTFMRLTVDTSFIFAKTLTVNLIFQFLFQIFQILEKKFNIKTDHMMSTSEGMAMMGYVLKAKRLV